MPVIAMSKIQFPASEGNFTDVANFTLRCLVCQKGLKGQGDAVEHAKAAPVRSGGEDQASDQGI